MIPPGTAGPPLPDHPSTGRPLIAVFGSGGEDTLNADRARRLGAALAAAGFGIVNGGYGGTMEAAAEGARSAGGSALGVTCAQFTFRSGPNGHCSEVFEAPTLFARLEELITRARGYVVLPGGNGTLTELSLTWEVLRRELVPSRPLVVWEDPWRRVLDALGGEDHCVEGEDHSAGRVSGAISWVRSVDRAVDAIRRGVAV
ncbi:MAG: LOG family protein [Gemmatimonadota bacterium]